MKMKNYSIPYLLLIFHFLNNFLNNLYRNLYIVFVYFFLIGSQLLIFIDLSTIATVKVTLLLLKVIEKKNN